MPFVLDASVSATWCFGDETSPLADTAESLLRSDVAVVPRLWWYEIRNLLVVNERKHRLTSIESAAFLAVLSRYPIEFDEGEDEEAIFRFARHFRLSFYDAAYLEVAYRRGFPLATLDKALQSAAVAAGVPLLA